MVLVYVKLNLKSVLKNIPVLKIKYRNTCLVNL
jgi:hypothetical protein